MNNWLGLIIGFVYIFSVIASAEVLRRRLGLGPEFTRKIVHIGVGMLSWLVPFLFDSPWPFVAACLIFAVITFLDWKFGFFVSMQSSNKNNLGTVYFPLVAAVVALVFWDHPPLLVASLMPLTWGDGLAPVIGRTYGNQTYVVFRHTRSVQGSVAFLIAGGFFTWLALWLMPGSPALTPIQAILPALTVIVSTTFVEAVSPWGIDNITVTAVAVLILSVWPF